jgi:hypothetical protein
MPDDIAVHPVATALADACAYRMFWVQMRTFGA